MNTPGNHDPSLPAQPGQSQLPIPGWKAGLSVDAALQLVQTRPLMVWGGIWASVLLIMLIATASLLSPTASSERRVSGAAIGSSSTQTTRVESGKSRIPLWLFGAIALTCTAGSILVSKQLAAPERPYRPSKQVPRKVAKRQVPKAQTPKVQASKAQTPKAQDVKMQVPKAQNAKVGVAKRQGVRSQDTKGQAVQRVTSPDKHANKQAKTYLPTEFAVPAVFPTPAGNKVTTPAKKSAPAKPSRHKPVRHKTNRRVTSQPLPPAATRVPVTVVPAEENHPLDWNGNSLADMLDLRKQHSLSFWIKE
jgi:hypothetical protein